MSLRVDPAPSLSAPSDHTQNALLARIPAESIGRLAPYIESVVLSAGQPLLESGGRIEYAWFPADCVVSLLFLSADGASSGVTTVGREGMVGITLLMGGIDSAVSTLVQHEGKALRIAAEPLQAEFERGDATQRVLLRYLRTRILGALQTTHCIRHHTVEQQLCRWLLESLDRQTEPNLTMTQEQIAALLGVRREAVTAAAGHLQRAGWIHYRRGHINVVDRIGLESHVCGCYGALIRQLEHLEKDFPPQVHSGRMQPHVLEGHPVQAEPMSQAPRRPPGPSAPHKHRTLLRSLNPLLAR